ncbi:MAG: hypothetical protein GY778_19625 [bacterium]|nr:hypothetical protein [bacterium]
MARRWRPLPLDETQARTNWRQLSAERQLAAVQEIVETRAKELGRAYTGVVSVVAGFKRRGQPNRPRKVTPQPAVIFVVQEKRARGSGPKRGRQVPECLFTYCTVRRRRRLCAVPTDVECATTYADISQENKTGSLNKQITVRRGGATLTGVLTCGVNLPSKSARTKPPAYAMSCRHVLGMSSKFKKPPIGASVRLGKTTLATTTSIHGDFQVYPRFSYDLALAFVTNLAALRKALGRLSLNDYVKKLEAIPKGYWIRTPRGALKASYVAPHRNFPIKYKGVGWLHHVLLIESELAAASTKGGYSGSPVVTRKNGGILLGMHIAGKGSKSMMIPAWLLMSCSNYPPAEKRGKLVLRNP